MFSLFIVVWNIKCQEKRLVTITPSDSWGGAGLLGVTIRLDDYGGAEERLIRVLEVEPSSPAAICGLKENSDYLLGTTADSFDSTSTLAQVLHRHLDKVVEVYVYNTDSDVVRVVALMPTYSWGGAGLLGAEVGTGYLHRLPASSRNTIGTSVERKVRLVGMKPVHPAEQQQSEAVLEVEPQLEMEVVDSFHEEAETRHKTVQQVADHGSNAGSNGVSKPPAVKQYTDQASAAKSNGNTTPTSQEETVKTEEPLSEAEPRFKTTTESAASEPSGEASRAEETIPAAAPAPQAPEHQQEAEPSGQMAQAAMSMPPPPPPADAAALFAAQPPDASAASSTSYASQFMPPPPMSSFSTDRQGEVDLR